MTALVFYLNTLLFPPIISVLDKDFVQKLLFLTDV